MGMGMGMGWDGVIHVNKHMWTNTLCSIVKPLLKGSGEPSFHSHTTSSSFLFFYHCSMDDDASTHTPNNGSWHGMSWLVRGTPFTVVATGTVRSIYPHHVSHTFLTCFFGWSMIVLLVVFLPSFLHSFRLVVESVDDDIGCSCLSSQSPPHTHMKYSYEEQDAASDMRLLHQSALNFIDSSTLASHSEIGRVPHSKLAVPYDCGPDNVVTSLMKVSKVHFLLSICQWDQVR
jgi:hypothetical protein